MATRRNRGFGRLYNGSSGQWAWFFHRFTGVAVILFLFAHVVDTAVIAWGPEAYNKVMAAYANPLVRLAELGLIACVLFHSFNGVKIMLFDFWPNASLHYKGLTRITLAVFIVSMLLVSTVMIPDILHSF